jgi:jacalin-like lectin domain-containing protein
LATSEKRVFNMAYAPTPEYGGGGGNTFSDDITQSCRVQQVNIQSGDYVDAIQMEYVTPAGTVITGPLHGGPGGTAVSFELAPNEQIVTISGSSGDFVDSLTFTTSLGNVWGPYGGSGGAPFSITGVNVGGIFGRSGQFLDAIGFYSPAACQ